MTAHREIAAKRGAHSPSPAWRSASSSSSRVDHIACLPLGCAIEWPFPIALQSTSSDVGHRTVAHLLIDLDGIDDAAHLFARPGLLVLARAGTNDEHQFSPRHDPEF
jgi:hypothetical protein